MMHAVRHIESAQITPTWNIAEGPALMDQPVMNNKIEQAIQRHPCTDPLQRPDACAAQINKQNRQAGKDDSVKIVNLKPAFMRFMM